MKTKVRFLALVGVPATIGGVFAIVVLTSSSAAGSSPCDSSAIVALAKQYAAQGGESNPTLIQHSAMTTRSQANVTGGAGTGISGDQESYLIAVRGHFVVNAPRPSGAPAPTGSVLTLVVDASSCQVTDVGIQDNYPDLGSLGPVTTDYDQQ